MNIDYIDDNYSKGNIFFDIEKEYFLIASDSLDKVQTKLYGFSVQGSGIYEDDNFTDDAAMNLDGCGTYIYVRVDKNLNEISIQQDFNGSWGLYLYQDDEYFALSNSFFRLLDYLKTRKLLSLNRNYANYILCAKLADQAYAETAVNEIKLIRRDANIYIDIKKAQLRIVVQKYDERSIALDSIKGINILDQWYQKWISIFKNINAYTSQMIVDLSGGIDSRITFLLMICSGIDLNTVNINSANDNLHTHSEDYSIATQIASHYGYELNRGLRHSERLNYSLEDIINIEYYTEMTFHKELYYKRNKYIYKQYNISGAGGGSIRALWPMTQQAFSQKEMGVASHFSPTLAKEMKDSIGYIIQTTYDAIDNKYNLNDPTSLLYPALLNLETRSRHHFGKSAVENYFANIFNCSPLNDINLLKLQLNTSECTDTDLLIALIFQRYLPELLNFPFEGGRTINEETILYAQNINSKYPINEEIISPLDNNEFKINPIDNHALAIINNGKNNEIIPKNEPDEYLNNVFKSHKLRTLFSLYFDDEIYTYAEQYSNMTIFYPMRHKYAIIGITRVIEDILVSNNIVSNSHLQMLEYLISDRDYRSYNYQEYLSDLIARQRNRIAARIDIKLFGNNQDFEIVDISDIRACITKPSWFQKDGLGYVIEAYRGVLDIKCKIKSDGVLCIKLRGLDICDAHGNRIPYWIDYQNVTYNGDAAFHGIKPVWHDKPITIQHTVNTDDIVELHVEWAEHKE